MGKKVVKAGGKIGKIVGKEGGKYVGREIAGKKGAKVGGEIGGIVGEVAGEAIAREAPKIYKRMKTRQTQGGVIASMKKGGHIRRTGLYRLHKGEYVLPLKKVRALQRQL